MTFNRCAGVLLHPTALPGPHGVGDLGQGAYQFIDWLVAAKQSLWQVLPLNPPDQYFCPYSSTSAFGGNTMLIDLFNLVDKGWLDSKTLKNPPAFNPHMVEAQHVAEWKNKLLWLAYQGFLKNEGTLQSEVIEFHETHHWLRNHALFTALKAEHNGLPWWEWSDELRNPDAKTRIEAWERLNEQVTFECFKQWVFYTQWMALKKYANDRGIQIIGDIPIYVSWDSADVWANQSFFKLDEHGHPTVIAGVPPDYFSETGQRWGNPIYEWKKMSQNGYQWWHRRLSWILHMFDVARIDHFRGFERYWEIPAEERTAINGRWVPGPGADLFTSFISQTGRMGQRLPIIAEDLGDFMPEARVATDTLMAQFGFPGMKVLQFGFGGKPDNPHLPHNFTPDTVVYTGTHDNDTTVGWHQNSPASVGEHLAGYAGKPYPLTQVSWEMIRLAWASIADVAITPFQDIEGLGSFARFNIPGTTKSANWTWRFDGARRDDLARKLAVMTHMYGRTTY